MNQEEILNEYFEWLFYYACQDKFSDDISYRKLLMQLHTIEFTWIIPKDENRAEDGIELRRRFSLSNGFEDDYFPDYIDGPCSVLEMMVALAIKCEETIMDDPNYGDRTGQWFWSMMVSLGLGDQVDTRIDKIYVKNTIDRFLNRGYKPNGKGGLFTIRKCDYDLRDVEIWVQLCWYLDSVIG